MYLFHFKLYYEVFLGALTLMVEFLEPSQPDEEENDEEEERPDDLDEEATPVPFSQGQVLPEKQLKLEEEGHLVATSSSSLLELWS